MRGARVMLAMLAAIIIAGASLYILRKPAAGYLIRRVMAEQGLVNPQARVMALTFSRIRIEDVNSAAPSSLDAPLLQLEQVDVAFRLGEALRNRRVNSVAIGPGFLRVDITEDGAVRAAGISFDSKAGEGGGALPFDRLLISDLAIDVATPKGIAHGALNAQYDAADGGEATAVMEAALAGLYDVTAKDASLEARLAFANDGVADMKASLSGDIQSPYGRAILSGFSVEGKGASWRDLAAGDWRAFNGAATIRLEETTIETEDTSLGTLFERHAEIAGGEVKNIVASGVVSLSSDQGVIMVKTDDRPISLVADTGASLSLDAAMGEPVLVMENGRSSLAGVITFRGGDISVIANLDARQMDDGWRFDMPLRFGAFATPSLSLSETSAIVRGSIAKAASEFQATASGEVVSAALGRFSVANTPLNLTMRGVVDGAAKTATLRLPDNTCAALDRISVKIASQDMDASLKKARLCAGEAPIAVIDFNNDPVTDFSGILSAASGHYRLGGTRIAGAPPTIDLAGRYRPGENHTTASGTARGGSVVMNELLRIDRVDAALDFELDKSAMTINIDANKARVSEYGAAAKVAPIIVDGTMVLSTDIARFDYRGLTEGGAVLGAGTGRHNITTGSGEASFQFKRLRFAPGGLQPDELAPVLKGIIGLTTGAATGDATFAWGDDGITSGATIAFDNLTFRGPGLTVTKTVGVTGEIEFSSLWPIATAGGQTITVAGVDFGALQLQDGEILFDMPGDETLLIERAIFPWFGGRIGVRDATASFNGGNAVAPLSVESVDLKQILDFLNVNGLSGAGTLTGELPLIVEGGRASFVDGHLTAEGPGWISYVGNAADAAASAGGDAQIAFDVLRDLRYESLSVLIDGPLDGQLDFQLNFVGTGAVSINRAQGRVPVKYNITLEAALLELLNQANLSRNLELQIKRAVEAEQP